MDMPILIVVDDEPEMAKLVGRAGESVGFDVRIAHSVQEFQDAWAVGRVSAVVSDIVMPDMDGIELLQWLAAQNATIPVVLMSGYDRNQVEIARRLGIAKGLRLVGILNKPIPYADVKTVLSKVLNEVR